MSPTSKLQASAVFATPAIPAAPAPDSGRERKHFALMLLLALMVNVLLIAALFFRLPEHMRPAEPPAISVELVKPPAPEAETRPEPKPESPPAPKPSPQMQRRESGGDPKLAPGRTPETKTSEPLKEEFHPQPRKPKPDASKEALPDWAMKLSPGFDVAAPEKPGTPPRASAAAPVRSRSALSGKGGGDAYLNALRDRILRALVYPAREARNVPGSARYQIVVTRQGMLLGIRLLESSGNPDFDQAGAEAIQGAAPFAPLPPDVPGNAVSMELVLHVEQ